MANKVTKIKGTPPESKIQLGAPTGGSRKSYEHERTWVKLRKKEKEKQGALTRQEASMPTPANALGISAAQRGVKVGDQVGGGSEASRIKKAYDAARAKGYDREDALTIAESYAGSGAKDFTIENADTPSAENASGIKLTSTAGKTKEQKAADESLGKKVVGGIGAIATGVVGRRLLKRRKAKAAAANAPATPQANVKTTGAIGLGEKRGTTRRTVAVGPPKATGERRGILRRTQDVAEFDAYKQSINAPSGYTYQQALGKKATPTPTAPVQGAATTAPSSVSAAYQASLKAGRQGASTGSVPSSVAQAYQASVRRRTAPPSTTLVTPPPAAKPAKRGRKPKAAAQPATPAPAAPAPAPAPAAPAAPQAPSQAPSKGGSRPATIAEIDEAIKRHSSQATLTREHKKQIKALQAARKKLEQQQTSIAEEAARKSTGTRTGRPAAQPATGAAATRPTPANTPSATQPGSNTAAKKQESPTHGGIDKQVAETKGRPAAQPSPEFAKVKAAAQAKYEREVAASGGQAKYDASVEAARKAKAAAADKEVGRTFSAARPGKGKPAAQPIDSPIPIKDKAQEVAAKPKGPASASTSPDKIPDNSNEVVQKIRDEEAKVATAPARGKGKPAGQPAVVKRAEGLPPLEPAAPPAPAQGSEGRTRAILRKNTAEERAAKKAAKAQQAAIGNPAGTPSSVTTKAAPIEASIPLKQRQAELEGLRAEQAKAGTGSRPGRQAMPPMEKRDPKIKTRRKFDLEGYPERGAGRRVRDLPLPSKPSAKTPDSQDDIIKGLRDLESENATRTVAPSKPRGDEITAPVAGKPPDKSTADVGVSQALSKSNAAETAKRQKAIEAHMKKKGFTRISGSPDTGLEVEAITPKGKKAPKAPKGKPAGQPKAAGFEPWGADPTTAKPIEQRILETPAQGEMGKALRKAARSKTVKGGTAAAVGLGVLIGATERASAAMPGQRLQAAKEGVKEEILPSLKAAATYGVAAAVAPTATALASAPLIGAGIGAGAQKAKSEWAGVFSARKEAKQEAAGSAKKYGTVEAATQTRRRLSDQAKRRKPMSLDQAGRLMDRWKK